MLPELTFPLGPRTVSAAKSASAWDLRSKKNADGTATVNRNKYNLFAAKDRVFVKDPTQELKLLDAMRKGNSLTVVIASESGTTVTDTYSLSGVGSALQKLQETCF